MPNNFYLIFMRRIHYDFGKFKGLSAYFDDRVERLDKVLCGHLNNRLCNTHNRAEFDMLYKLHSALVDYLEFYDI